MDNPVLQFDQFTLQSEELTKIEPTIDLTLAHRSLCWAVHQELIEPVVVELHLELLIVAVKGVSFGTCAKLFGGHRGVHGLCHTIRLR